ncbi:transposase B [Burkholderia lata]|nr:transposase B [Burkholderia lata]
MVVIEQRQRHYNSVRPHLSLAYLQPDEFKQQYCSTDATKAVLQD